MGITKLASQQFNKIGIVANGYQNLIRGIWKEARQVVEAKYAEEYNAVGIVQRWKLRRMIKSETRKLATEMMPDVSDRALF